MRRIRVVLVCWTLLLTGASQAAAQQRPVMLVPADAPRWDVAGQVGWLGGKEHVTSIDWFQVGSANASVGYYWTPHLKLEADVGASGTGGYYTQQQLTLPGYVYPLYASRRHQAALRTVSGVVSYQLFENQWVHPFLSGGVDLVREHDQREAAIVYVPGDLRTTPSQVVVDPAGTTVDYAARPTLGGGAKFYVSPRAFVRTDLRWTFTDGGVATVTWRGGIGIDF